jgi:hypothetical protein
MSGDLPIVMLVRPLPGLVGERDRLVHIVPVPPGGSASERLTAYCGLRFEQGTTEVLSAPHGMPCFRCVVEAPTPDGGDLPAASG